MDLPRSLSRSLPRRLSRFIPACGLLAAACAAPPPEPQLLQRFYPDSEQLISRTAREAGADGTLVRHGAAEFFYPDGQPQSRSWYVLGVPDGEFLQWHAGGEPACRGRYAMGRRSGEWSLFDADGTLRERSHWRDGILEGEAGAWDADGQRIWEGSFAHGRRNGTFEAFHANGQPRVRGDFKAGVPVGRFTAWYADGTRADEGRYKDGEPHGMWVIWNPQGEQVLDVSLRQGRAGAIALPAELDWDPAHAPAANPFDLAAVFAMQPSADEPELPAVVLAPSRKPTGVRVSLKATPAELPAEAEAEGEPAKVGVH